MRNAPIPVFFHNNIEKALEFSRKQSYTTHQGVEAAECSALMTWIILNSIKNNIHNKNALDFCTSFQTDSYSMKCLCESKQEETHSSNQNLKLEDRNWNWKDVNFKYSINRSNDSPGYIGSYCMDAMSMALHCIYTTNSFEEALLKVVNLRGDSDSVASVVGQIAGGIYGLSSIPKEWIQTVSKWDIDYLIGLRIYKLLSL